jgi:hypothetical protein
MQNAEAYYISQVLGIQHVLPPESPTRTTEPAATQAILVLTPFELTREEKEMAEKMLAAAEIKEKIFCTLESLTEQNVSFGLAFGVEEGITTKINQIRWTCLPSIAQFLKTEDQQKLAALKRSAWTQLQALKKAISG